jgi:HTH-type transcriptional regulator / antitoxin HigA
MAIERQTWQPDWAVPPGEILLELLDERGISQSELARRMGRPTKTINEIVNGKAAITPETAIQLELTLGIVATFWNNLEATYRAHVAQERASQELEANSEWLDQFPLQDLIRNRLVERGRTKAETFAGLLAFFGVGSPSALEAQWSSPAASFRSSPAFVSAPQAVAAWLRWGEILARDTDTAPFNAARMREVLDEARRLTRQADFMHAVDELKTMLASAGVVLALTPEFSGTHLSGAVRWLSPTKVLIQLSGRHGTTDHFWFSFFHEAGHVLGASRIDVLDEEPTSGNPLDVDEQEVDRFARDALLPPDAYDEFVSAGDFSDQCVRRFARDQGVHPGIVVGRLQTDEKVELSHLNDLKKRFKWPKVVTRR